jgi:cell division transport system permease protein
MKIRTVKYVVKEGIKNAVRNKLMTIASICVVAATLLVFGIFYLVTANLQYNTDLMQQQPEIQVYCSPELDDVMVAQIEQTIKNNQGVKSTETVTKKQAFEKLKDMLGENKSLLEGLDESFLSVSFIVKLSDPKAGSNVVKELEAINGVEKVTFPEETVQGISKLNGLIQFISILLIIVLLIVSTFIISNTIKLTVFARRKEINIMKFIGGTDWFIRWPFIVEGVIIGVVGALIAFLIIGFGYDTIQNKVDKDFANISFNMIKLLSVWSVAAQMLIGYIVVGAFVGVAGSALSIRKHLRV